MAIPILVVLFCDVAIDRGYEQKNSVVSANAGHNCGNASGSPPFVHLVARFPADFETVALFRTVVRIVEGDDLRWTLNRSQYLGSEANC